jgi:protein ImuB
MTRRVLALALPELPVEVARREAPRLAGRPLVLVTHGVPGTRASRTKKPRAPGARAGTLRVAAASIEARAAGVRIGMTCAHAMGVLPAVVAREHRPEADDAALLGLARWASVVLSPRVAPDLTRSALLLDAVGLTPVHGDEPTLVARARAGLAALGFSTRAALADTPLAALALALESPHNERGGERGCGVVAPPGQTRAALGPLPPRALPLSAAALTALARLGIDTIDGLLRLPRAGLPARLGEEVLLALDRALGVRDDPLACVALPERLFERLETTSESGAGTDRLADLAFGLETLAERVARRLDAEGRGARALELTLARDDARPVSWALRLAEPIAGARTLVRVLHRRLERQDLSVPVTALELVITETAPLVARQTELFDQDAGARPASTEDLPCLLARLEGLLGARQVLRVDLVPDHRPERAFVACPASGAPARRTSALDAPRPPPGPRPTRLLARPLQVGVLRDDEHAPPRALRLGGEVIALCRATGPERLETGFWDEAEVRRDYWVVAGEDGRAWWVYRSLDTGEWFLHGAFD